jgi:gliding motility-associated-like protein
MTFSRALLLLLFLVPVTAFSQRQGDVWFFGEGLLMDFQTNTPLVNSSGVITSQKASSSISDNSGALLFYTNGWQLYNKYNLQLPGWPFASTPYVPASLKAQGTLLLPVNDSLDLCFNLSTGTTPSYGNGGYYTEINPKARSDSGEVISGVIQFGDSLTEHLTAVRHADGEGWWVISHYTRTDVFVKLHIGTNGNVTRFDQQVGNTYPSLSVPYTSPMIFNQKGDQIAVATHLGRIDILAFNRCTGELDLLYVIDKGRDSTNAFYGVSFSPSGKYLYVSDQFFGPSGSLGGYSSNLLQFDIQAPNPQNSEQIVWSSPPPCESWWTGQFCRRAIGGHKLGPDGKIYIGNVSNDGNLAIWDSLSVISKPDLPAAACDFYPLNFGLPSGTGSAFFPNIPNYRLGPLVAQVAEAGPDTTICPGESAILGIPDTSGTLVFTWWTTTGAGGTLSTTSAAQPIATPLTATTYYLMVEDTTVHASCATTIDSVRIELYDTTNAPRAYAGRDTLICQGDSIQLGLPDPSGGTWLYQWSPSSGLSDPTFPTPVARPSISTTYHLEVWDTIAGQRIPCREAFDTVFIEVEEQLEHPIPESQDFCPGEVLTIGLPPLPGFEYRWMPPTGLRDPYASLTQVAPQDAIAYQLQITDLSKLTENCRTRNDLVTLTTDGCILQNVLTPNGDGINDVLFLGLYNQAVQLAIFDRWGKKIYASSRYANDFRGDGLPDGVYYYVLKVSGEGGKEVVGNFVLMR